MNRITYELLPLTPQDLERGYTDKQVRASKCMDCYVRKDDSLSHLLSDCEIRLCPRDGVEEN